MSLTALGSSYMTYFPHPLPPPHRSPTSTHQRLPAPLASSPSSQHHSTHLPSLTNRHPLSSSAQALIPTAFPSNHCRPFPSSTSNLPPHRTPHSFSPRSLPVCFSLPSHIHTHFPSPLLPSACQLTSVVRHARRGDMLGCRVGMWETGIICALRWVTCDPCVIACSKVSAGIHVDLNPA